MYKPNQGQIEYHRNGIKENIRNDGRSNVEQRNIQCKKGILKQANGSSYVQVFDSQCSLYVGIKAEIIDIQKDQKEGEVALKIESMKRRDTHLSQQQKDNQYSDKSMLQQLEYELTEKYIKYINKQPLILVKDKKALKLNIDIFLIDYIHFGYVELIAYGIRKALEDFQIPDMDIQHNYLTNEEEIQLLEDQMRSLNLNKEFTVPYIFLIGEVEGSLVFDMTLEEYYSVQNRYLVTINQNLQICCLEKTGSGFLSPENIFKITKFVQNQTSKVIELEQQQKQHELRVKQSNNQNKMEQEI